MAGTVRRLLCLPLLLGMAACGSLLSEGSADLAGIAGAGAASAVTRSAAGAAAIGLVVRSVAAEGVKYAQRRTHREEQDAIAAIAGPLPPGGVAQWSVSHAIPLESDQHGELVVSREFGAAAFRCKELVFSVDRTHRDGTERAFYLTTICQDGAHWRWAQSEPATERWGGLQ